MVQNTLTYLCCAITKQHFAYEERYWSLNLLNPIAHFEHFTCDPSLLLSFCTEGHIRIQNA